MGRRTRDYHCGVILFPLRYTVQPDVRVSQYWPRLYRMSGPSDRDEKKQEALKGFTTGPLVTSQTRTSPRFSRLHFRLFQVHPKFLGYSAHVTRSVTMRRNILTSAWHLRYGLKILTDSWIEGDSLGYLDHPPRRCHPGRQPTFIHFFTNTLKCLHGRLAG